MQRQRSEQSKGRSLHEFVFASCPLPHFLERVWSAVKQLETDGVANGPVVEVATPTIHLRGRHLFGVVDKRCSGSRLVPTCLPQGKRKFVTRSELSGQLLRIRHAHTESFIGESHSVVPSRRESSCW